MNYETTICLIPVFWFLSVSAQTGTADTIYVDVPAEVE